ncbi:MAG: peptide/nickel transport system permease protein [Candidatus Azotimanducaceae bacterium]
MLGLVPILLIVSLLTFGMSFMVPGDVRDRILGLEATAEQYEELGERLGLNDPFLVQYGRWLINAVQGDLGTSSYNSQKVSDAVLDTLPVTLSLTVGGMLIAISLGVPAGVYAGLHRGSRIDQGAVLIATIGQAIPNFWIAMLLLIPFALWWQLVPATGFVSPTESITGWLNSIVLASVALGTSASAALARQTRGAIIDVLQQDYIRTARSKGLPSYKITFKHALKNAAIPIITTIGFQVNGLLGGALIVEQVFGLNGFGSLAIDSVRSQNIPMMQGVVIMGTLIIVGVNLLVDIAYGFVNPRMRTA